MTSSLSCTPAKSVQHPISEPLALVTDVVHHALAEQRLVGAVVLAYQHSQTLCRMAAGWADREAGVAMSENMVFRWASASKPVISAAVLRLVAQGRIALDEPVTTWLPAFRPRLPDGGETNITVRQLLSHTAGLGYRFLEPDAHGPYTRAGVSDGMDASGIDLQENLRRIASVPLLYAPGTGWGYSLAVDVLGAVVEAASDMGLPQAIETLVTRPLGMVDAGFSCLDAARMATAYVNDNPVPHRLQEGEVAAAFEGTVGIAYSPSRAFDERAFPSGGAGMVGTADDLLRLLEALRTGRDGWMPEHLIAEMARDQTQGQELAAGPGLGFGLGFSVLRDPALARSPESRGTWRWGGAYGHAWWVDRPRGLTVVAMTNTLYEGMSGRFVSALRDAVYRGLQE